MNKKRITVYLLLALIISTLAFTGCSRKLMWVGNSGQDHIQATYKRFTGTEKKNIRVEEGDTLVIVYQSEVSEGNLSVTITGPQDDEIVSLETGTEGTERLGIEKTGRYSLWIKGDKTGGSFEISWDIE